MIITRTPFRISFCGGGSDLPAYYRKHGGCVISTSIDKYMYIVSHQSFDPAQTVLKYSKIETVNDINKIEHQIFRECLKQNDLAGYEFSSVADIPQGTGLGSSSSFTVGLLHNIHCIKRDFVDKYQLAEEACEMEINVCGSPIGKQDQYAATFGGLNFYRFNKDDTVSIEPVLLPSEQFTTLEDNLIMIYVGGEHQASLILREQSKNIASDQAKIDGQQKIVEMTYELKKELELGNIDALGRILDKNWEIKRTLASGISNPKFNEIYDLAINNGALGGKILGAGGSGFFLFYVPKSNQDNFRKAMADYREMPFKFDHNGTTVVCVK